MSLTERCGETPFPHKILITGPLGSGKTGIVDNIVVKSPCRYFRSSVMPGLFKLEGDGYS